MPGARERPAGGVRQSPGRFHEKSHTQGPKVRTQWERPSRPPPPASPKKTTQTTVQAPVWERSPPACAARADGMSPLEYPKYHPYEPAGPPRYGGTEEAEHQAGSLPPKGVGSPKGPKSADRQAVSWPGEFPSAPPAAERRLASSRTRLAAPPPRQAEDPIPAEIGSPRNLPARAAATPDGPNGPRQRVRAATAQPTERRPRGRVSFLPAPWFSQASCPSATPPAAPTPAHPANAGRLRGGRRNRTCRRRACAETTVSSRNGDTAFGECFPSTVIFGQKASENYAGFG